MFHPADDRCRLGNVTDDILLLIEGGEAFGEGFRVSFGEFGNSVDTGGFEQFAKFGTDAVDTVEVHHVGKFQDRGFGNAGRLGERLALRGGSSAGEQRISIGDTGFAELGSEHRTDAFYVFNFVVGHV